MYKLSFFSIFAFLQTILVTSNYIYDLNKVQRRNTQNNDDSFKSHPLDSTGIFGNTSNLMYYYVNIYIGTPPKRQSLIIDTGSALTGIPCQPYCTSCGKHLNSYYKIEGFLINLFRFKLKFIINLPKG